MYCICFCLFHTLFMDNTNWEEFSVVEHCVCVFVCDRERWKSEKWQRKRHNYLYRSNFHKIHDFMTSIPQTKMMAVRRCLFSWSCCDCGCSSTFLFSLFCFFFHRYFRISNQMKYVWYIFSRACAQTHRHIHIHIRSVLYKMYTCVGMVRVEVACLGVRELRLNIK